jgi:hypothetical protein
MLCRHFISSTGFNYSETKWSLMESFKFNLFVQYLHCHFQKHPNQSFKERIMNLLNLEAASSPLCSCTLTARFYRCKPNGAGHGTRVRE